MPRSAIWIDEGCIQCFWCQNLEPTVFAVSDDGCEIRAEVRSDARTDSNRQGRARLNDGVVTEANAIFMQFVADGCPAQVIKLETELSVVIPVT